MGTPQQGKYTGQSIGANTLIAHKQLLNNQQEIPSEVQRISEVCFNLLILGVKTREVQLTNQKQKEKYT